MTALGTFSVSTRDGDIQSTHFKMMCFEVTELKVVFSTASKPEIVSKL